MRARCHRPLSSERQRQRDAEPPDRADRERDVDVVEGRGEEQDADRERAPADDVVLVRLRVMRASGSGARTAIRPAADPSSVSMSHQRRGAESRRRASGRRRRAAAPRRSASSRRRRMASSSASNSAGVKTNSPVSSASQVGQVLADRDDAVPGQPHLGRFGGDRRDRMSRVSIASTESAGVDVERGQPLAAPAASNRWSPISSAKRRPRHSLPRGEGRDAVLEVPVGVDRRTGRSTPGIGCRSIVARDPLGLVAEHDVEGRHAGRRRRLERAQDERLPKDGV